MILINIFYDLNKVGAPVFIISTPKNSDTNSEEPDKTGDIII
jgi:hypothetical protein